MSKNAVKRKRIVVLGSVAAVLLGFGLYVGHAAEHEGSFVHRVAGYLSGAQADLATGGYVYLEEDDTSEAEKPQAQAVVSDELSHALAEEILRRTNEERAKQGLSALTRHEALEHAAVDHSAEMRALNYFSHTSPTAGKATTRQRVNHYGVNPQMVAENIFECSGYDIQKSAEIAVEAFMNSPEHRKNMLNPTVTHIGVGFVAQDGSVSVTQVFGAGL